MMEATRAGCLVNLVHAPSTAFRASSTVGKEGVGQEIGLQVVEDVFHRIQLRAVGREPHERQICRDYEIVGPVPSGAVENDHGVSSRLHLVGDFGEMPVHLASIGLVTDVADGGTRKRTGG